jgi:dihydrofolate reductase
MVGQSGGSEGVDDGIFKSHLESKGPTIMGRNMFGPVRGPWGASEWNGWWGEEPPFRHPVFVLTHYERPDLVLGETTFHFVTGGVHEALRRAHEVPGDEDITLAGGVATIRMFLDAQLIDELWLSVVPLHIGAGERLLKTLEDVPAGYERRREIKGEGATHVEFARVAAN